MKKLSLIIEKSKDGKLWGRVEFDDNLLLDSANSVDSLERKMKKLLLKFHQINPSHIEFGLFYDLSALFTKINYLNASAVALKARINPALMRQYVAGFKYPSLERARSIEKVINDLGQELIGIKLAVVKKDSPGSAGAPPRTTLKKRTRVVA